MRLSHTNGIQLVPIGTFHSGEMHPEYLCVVSREYPESENACANYEGSDRAQVLQKKAMRKYYTRVIVA